MLGTVAYMALLVSFAAVGAVFHLWWRTDEQLTFVMQNQIRGFKSEIEKRQESLQRTISKLAAHHAELDATAGAAPADVDLLKERIADLEGRLRKFEQAVTDRGSQRRLPAA